MPGSIDEMLGELPELKLMKDEELLKKYAPCFEFEKDFIAKAGKLIVREEGEAGDDVEEATKRILEKKKQKQTKKQQQEEELKKMLLDDAALLGE